MKFPPREKYIHFMFVCYLPRNITTPASKSAKRGKKGN